MTTPRSGIKKKILVSVLAMAIVSLSVFCAVAFGGLFGIRAQMQQSSGRLGEFAAENSSRFLESEAVDKLKTKADASAGILHERLAVIAKDVAYFAEIAKGIYENAAALPPRPIPYSDSKNRGKFTMQLRSPNGKADYPLLKKEAELLGNIAPTYESNSGDMTSMTVSVYIGTESGVFLIFDEFSDDRYQSFDPRLRPWYVGAKERGGTFWTPPYAGFGSGRNMVTCSRPVYGKGGKLLGVTGIDVIIDDLDAEIVNINANERGQIFVVDSEGMLILSKDLGKTEDGAYERKSAYRDGCPLFNKVIDKMKAGESGFEKVVTEKGEKYIAYSPVPAAGWSVAVAEPVAEIMRLVTENNAAIEEMTGKTLNYVNGTIMVMLVIFSVVFILSLAAVVFFTDRIAVRITNPILVLEECLGRIAGGDLDTRIELKTGDEIERLGGCVNAMALELKHYIRNLQSVTAERERIGAELDVAKTIQASMLPCIFPPFPDRPEFDIYALMQPAKEVGGDFYDFFFIDRGTLAVVMADVSGKGVPAALFMVIAKILIKSNAQAGKSPREVFETVNNMLCENNETGMFVTAFMGYLNVTSGNFPFVNAGHNPPILRTGGKCGFLKVKPGFVIGGMEGITYRQDEITLRKGDELFLYTDGLTEAANNDNDLFGDKRLINAVDGCSGKRVADLVMSIKRGVDDFAQDAEQADDITMLALRFNGLDDSDTRVDELVIDAKKENLEAVQAFIIRKLDGVNCPAKPRDHIAVVAEEIFVNIASYAYDQDNGAAIIRVSVNKNEITIEFEDSGRPYNPLERPDPDTTKNAEEREIGGLGIFMVKHMADAADYRREGGRNILTVRKRLK